MNKGGKKPGIVASLFFLLLLTISIVSANNITTPATIIPTPDGVYIYITEDDNMSFLLQENTGTTFINDEGEVEYRAIHSPFGEVVSEGGIDPNSITKPWNSWDDDVGLYVGGESYDPKSGVWLGLHWPTLGSELGNSLWGAAKSIGTLGIYNAYQSYKYNFANPPATWGEVGLRTIDQTPVAGSVKAAIESDNWVDAASNSLNALGSGILIGTGLTAKFAPNTYARLSQIKIPPQNVFYVDPYGVAIASKWGVPSERAFVGAPLTVIQQRGLSKALDPIIDLIFETIKKMGVKIRRLPPIYKEEDIIASVNKFLMEEYTKQGRISPAVHATSKEALQGIMRDKGFNQQMFMSYPGQGMLPFGKGAAIIVKPEYIGKPVTILDSHLLGLPPGSGHVAFILGKGEIPTKYLLYFDPSQNKFVPFPE